MLWRTAWSTVDKTAWWVTHARSMWSFTDLHNCHSFIHCCFGASLKQSSYPHSRLTLLEFRWLLKMHLFCWGWRLMTVAFRVLCKYSDLLIDWLTDWLIHSFIHSLIHSFFVDSFIHSLDLSFIHSLIWFVYIEKHRYFEAT